MSEMESETKLERYGKSRPSRGFGKRLGPKLLIKPLRFGYFGLTCCTAGIDMFKMNQVFIPVERINKSSP